MQLGDAAFLFISTILDAILNFDFSNNSMMSDAVFEQAWSDEQEEFKTGQQKSELFASYIIVLC